MRPVQYFVLQNRYLHDAWSLGEAMYSAVRLGVIRSVFHSQYNNLPPDSRGFCQHRVG